MHGYIFDLWSSSPSYTQNLTDKVTTKKQLLMNQAHFHLVLNHLPILIPLVGLLVMVGGLFLRSDIVKQTAYAIFILGALSTIPAFATGDGAEEVVEHLPGISESFIHTHEELAETFAILSYLLGGVSLIGFWASWKKKAFANGIVYATIFLSGIVLYYAQATGTSGGEIRHTEIRSDQASVSAFPLLHEDEDDN
jgi:uncharacterized membrane protein